MLKLWYVTRPQPMSPNVRIRNPDLSLRGGFFLEKYDSREPKTFNKFQNQLCTCSVVRQPKLMVCRHLLSLKPVGHN